MSLSDRGTRIYGTHVQVGNDVLGLGSRGDLVNVVHGLLKLLLLARSNVDLGAVLSKPGCHHLANTRSTTSHENNLALNAKEIRRPEVIEVWSRTLVSLVAFGPPTDS